MNKNEGVIQTVSQQTVVSRANHIQAALRMCEVVCDSMSVTIATHRKRAQKGQAGLDM